MNKTNTNQRWRKSKNKKLHGFLFSVLLLTLIRPVVSYAFDSGSTGADGAFAPVSDITIAVPESGIFNFTTMNIPEGVTVTLGRNMLNTAAIILVQGDAVIEGNIDISGVPAGSLQFPPPGAFRGALGANPGNAGNNGLGPGAGQGGSFRNADDSTSQGCGGTGAGFGNIGQVHNSCIDLTHVPIPGQTYGALTLQPLLGGSGGGSGARRAVDSISILRGTGGSGGGALLLAVTGTLTFNGQILAKGGNGEGTDNTTNSGGGGGGSGGGVRIVASTLTGSGNIDVRGGNPGAGTNFPGGAGGYGRIRMETEVSTFTGTVTPAGVATLTTPNSLFVANLPTLNITTVAGQSVSSTPNGESDVLLPAGTANPVTIEFTAVNVPLGTAIRLTITPAIGASTSALSSGLSGSFESSTASIDATLPTGPSVLSASVSFTLAAADGDALSNFAEGERVERIELASIAGSGSTTTFISVSGKKFTWPGLVAGSVYQ